ncbi:MAG: DUF5058 family protein [Synergistaceae bacterium]|nr:DUF5058 family protein [Synergistaceae bacterium]MBQ6739118.1 DUF5058 family protein [Synergistaceae bacterium]MBR0074344.1 DUF5058 family protein [Synergistaceae bacterium]MBR0079206.1 DUF5058 family protein [Synergistaceae bacterium]MBR0234660.1 DUF5058 family protein [Synergistaceae bacterium]
MDYLQISNQPIIWLLCGVTVLIAALQAYFFIRLARKTSASVSLDPAIPKKAFRIGLITAIGPALGVFIVMVGLMAAIGSPMSWLRLSIIGAAATELAAATNGATAAGVTFGGEGYTLMILAVSWFAMALNGAGWLVSTGLFTPLLEDLRAKVSGGDIKWLGVMSAACSIGIFGYLNANSMIAKGPHINMGVTSAVLGGAIGMMLLGKFVVPKYPRLAEYSLGIAMIIGILAGIIHDTIAV